MTLKALFFQALGCHLPLDHGGIVLIDRKGSSGGGDIKQDDIQPLHPARRQEIHPLRHDMPVDELRPFEDGSIGNIITLGGP